MTEPSAEEHLESDEDELWILSHLPQEEELEQLASADAPAALVAERYEVLETLGEGPHGRVYRVRDHDEDGREMALKILLSKSVEASDFLERMSAYRTRSADLASERVQGVAGSGLTELGLFYLATELLEGDDAARLAAKRGALPPRHALEIVRQVLEGLEHGHAAGVVHGALHGRNVFLESRIPWSEENPFGVGVRLLDYGLAALLREEDEPVPEVADDLRDAGLLLQLLLTGSAAITGAEVAPGTGLPQGLSRATRRLLQKALAEKPSARFGSATRFREALEATPEWRDAASNRSLWLVGASAVIAFGVTGGYLWWQRQESERVVQAADASSTEARLSAELERMRVESEAERERNREELTQAQREAELARERFATELATERGDTEEQQRMEENLAGLSVEVAGLRSEKETLLERASAAEGERSNLEQRVVSTESELADARSTIEELAARPPAVVANAPEASAVAYLERLLELVEDGEGGEAQRLFAGLPSDSILSVGATSDFLGSWSTSAAAMEAYETGRTAAERLAGLTPARASLPAAFEHLPEFLAESRRWATMPVIGPDGTEGDAEAAARPERIVRTMKEFETLYAEGSAELSPWATERWSEIAAGDPDRDPADVLAIAAWFEDGRELQFLRRYTRHIERLLTEDGRTRLARLRDVESLPAWSDVVASDAELAQTHVGGEVLLYRYALAWYYSGDEDETVPPREVRFQAAQEGGVLSGWRADLALRRELMEEEGITAAPGSRLLYHSTTPDGDVSWVLEVVREDDDPPAEATRSWTVEQHFFDEEGRARSAREVRVVQRGKDFFEDGLRRKEVLDLGDPRADVSQRSWSPTVVPLIPDRLPLRPGALEEFQERMGADERNCLVLRDGNDATWYLPGVGRVRHVDPLRVTLELVYADLPE